MLNMNDEIKINWELNLEETNLILDLISTLPINKGVDLFFRLKRQSELQFKSQSKQKTEDNATDRGKDNTDLQE